MSAPQNCRQNWLRSLLLSACALVAALSPSATATVAATTATVVIVAPAPVAAQPHIQGNDPMEQVAPLRGQVSTLAQHVGGFQRQLDDARACAPGFHRITVRLPVAGAFVVGCFDSEHPCDDTVRRAENTLLRDHRRIGRLEQEVGALLAHQTAIERVLTTFLDCGDRDSCEAAGEDARQRLADAYNASVALTGWALQQNDWDEAAVAEFQRLRDEAGRLASRLGDLEAWRTTVVTPRLASLEAEVARLRGLAQRTADDVAAARRRRITLGLAVGGLYLDGPGRAPGFGLVVGGLDVIGRPGGSASALVVAASFYGGYGQTLSGSRGGFASSMYAGAGYEWPNLGRLLLQVGYTRIESSRYRETSIFTVGGLRLRGEYDLSPAFTLFGYAGWEWGNAVDVSNGAAIPDVSRFSLGGGISVRLGNGPPPHSAP